MPSRYTSATNPRTPCTIVMAPGTGVCAPTVVAIATTNIDATMPAKIARFISSALSARAAQPRRLLSDWSRIAASNK